MADGGGNNPRLHNLQASFQQPVAAGAKFNQTPKPFATFGTQTIQPTIPAIVNKQFNSPVNLYSMQNIAETLEAHTELLAPGVKGINFMKPAVPVNTQSAVFLAILEEEQKAKGSQPAYQQSEHHLNAALAGAHGGHLNVHQQSDAELRQSSCSPTIQSCAFRRLQAALDAVEGSSPIPGNSSPISPQMRQGFPTNIARPGGPQQTYGGPAQTYGPPAPSPGQQQQQQQAVHQVQQQAGPSPPVVKHVQAPPPAQPRPVQAEGPQNVCHDCGRLIVGVFCRINDKSLHAECFKCSTCGTSLKNVGYFNINNKLYCEVHAQQAAQMISPRQEPPQQAPQPIAKPVPTPVYAPQPVAQPQPSPVQSAGPKVTIPPPSLLPQNSGKGSPALVGAVSAMPWHTPGHYHHVDAPSSPVPPAGQPHSLLQTASQPPPFAMPSLQATVPSGRPQSMYGGQAPQPWSATAAQQPTGPVAPGSKFAWPPKSSPTVSCATNAASAISSANPGNSYQPFLSSGQSQLQQLQSIEQQQQQSSAVSVSSTSQQSISQSIQSQSSVTSSSSAVTTSNKLQQQQQQQVNQPKESMSASSSSSQQQQAQAQQYSSQTSQLSEQSVHQSMACVPSQPLPYIPSTNPLDPAPFVPIVAQTKQFAPVAFAPVAFAPVAFAPVPFNPSSLIASSQVPSPVIPCPQPMPVQPQTTVQPELIAAANLAEPVVQIAAEPEPIVSIPQTPATIPADPIMTAEPVQSAAQVPALEQPAAPADQPILQEVQAIPNEQTIGGQQIQQQNLPEQVAMQEPNQTTTEPDVNKSLINETAVEPTPVPVEPVATQQSVIQPPASSLVLGAGQQLAAAPAPATSVPSQPIQNQTVPKEQPRLLPFNLKPEPPAVFEESPMQAVAPTTPLAGSRGPISPLSIAARQPPLTYAMPAFLPPGAVPTPFVLSAQAQPIRSVPKPISGTPAKVPPPTMPKPAPPSANAAPLWAPQPQPQQQPQAQQLPSSAQSNQLSQLSASLSAASGLSGNTATGNIPSSTPAPGQSTVAGSKQAPRRGKGQMKPQAAPSTRLPICGTCTTSIRGPFIVAMGKTWCPDHFLCANGQCKRSLQEIGFVEENGQLYCENCFEAYLAPTCAKCTSRIKGDCLVALDKQWHPQCFACSYCKKVFGNNSFYLEDGQPYCEKDWNELFTTKCIGCGYPIEAGDRWVEALNNNYHSQCFKCTVCHKNLEGQSFYAKGGRPFCKSHAR